MKKHEASILKDAKSNPKIVFNYINRKKPTFRGIKALKMSDNSLTTDPMKIAIELNSYFSSVFSTKHTDQLPHFSSRTDKTCELDPTKDITIEIVNTRLSKLNAHKSSGPDGISAYFLNRCSNSIAYPVSLILKKSLDEGSLPRDCKKATVSPIFKNGSKVAKNNYRQISLTCILCKLIERLIKDTILGFLLICDDQHGFLRNKSCFTNLLES